MKLEPRYEYVAFHAGRAVTVIASSRASAMRAALQYFATAADKVILQPRGAELPQPVIEAA